MGNPGNLGILLRHTLNGINDNQHHIGTLHRRNGSDDAVALKFFFNLALSAQSRRIDEDVFRSVMDNLRIHRIPGSACNIGYDYPVFPQQLIYDGGLSDIRLAHNGNSRTLVFLFFACSVLKMAYDRI